MGSDNHWTVTAVRTMPDRIRVDAENGDKKITGLELSKWSLTMKKINWQEIQKGRVLKIVAKGVKISGMQDIASIELVTK